MKAPVVLFAYRRKDKLMECIEALEKNKEVFDSELYIFSDGAKGNEDVLDVVETRGYLEKYKSESKFNNVVIEYADRNKGLANSIIYGVTKVIAQCNKAIIVEDDLIVTNDFLDFMNKALDYYEDDLHYGSISAFTYPLKELKNYPHDVYVTGKGECWGWGTWKNRWENVDWEVKDYEEYLKNRKLRCKFDKLEVGLDQMLRNQMEGKVDSWAVRWCYHLMKTEQWTVYPRVTKTLNIGFDGSGTNCGEKMQGVYQEVKESDNNSIKLEKLKPDIKLQKKCAIYEKSVKVRFREYLKKWMD